MDIAAVSMLPDRRMEVRKKWRSLKHRKDVLKAVMEDEFYEDKSKRKTSPVPFKLLSLHQAAREGLVDVVAQHIMSHSDVRNELDSDGYSPLHHAARYNRNNVLCLLMEAGADVNVRGQDDVTPLHLAAKYNCPEVAKQLLRYEADILARDVKQKTPLHYAARRGYEKLTQILLETKTCKVNIGDEDKTTPLHMAAIQGNLTVCEMLIRHGADIRARELNSLTPMMLAAAEGHSAVLELLLKAARDQKLTLLEFIEDKDNEGNTSLHFAVQNGKYRAVELLLDNKASVNSQKLNLATPLHLAAIYGFLDIARLLVENGAELDKRDLDQMTPVHRGSLYNRVDILKLLMSKGADMNPKDVDNFTPLHCACWKGQTETVEFLLDNGAQVAEVDISLKTVLHWTVECGHYSVLLTLLKHGGCNLLECRDKDDQTVMHYAAYMGNVSILKLLIDYGATLNTKDQEEKTPLHIAAQYDNLDSVETLIAASSSEINDDDIDGRTPLLLASLSGHYGIVKILLSLGADLSNRDDDRRTALMLAAMSGHVVTMAILLENHAETNAADKIKNTALHLACNSGHVEAVQLLLDKHADVTLKNVHKLTALDMAIDNLQSEVAICMLKHKSWQSTMSVRDDRHFTPMNKLIAKLPEAAQVVMDHCMQRTSKDDEDENLFMTFNYEYIDPGPDDPCSTNKRYFALKTMVQYSREEMLSHPLSQNLMALKWSKSGRFLFYSNLIIYVGYLISLMMYTAYAGDYVITTHLIDSVNYCPIVLTQEEKNNQTIIDHYIKHGKLTKAQLQIASTEEAYVIAVILTLFMGLFFIREVFKLFMQKLRYFVDYTNIIAVVLIVTTISYTSPHDMFPCLIQWRAGWLALFLSWINFMLYIRRIDKIGIYVIMFTAVLSSLLKAVVILLFFVCAFAGSFYIILARQKSFGDLSLAMMRVFVMTLGEIDFLDSFVEDDLTPFAPDVYALLWIFLFIMPIVVMNLMVGIAVGDIDKIMNNAYMKRLALQVDLIYETESKMPKWLQRRVHVKTATVKPNDYQNSPILLKMWRTTFSNARNVQFIQAEEKSKTNDKIDQLTSYVEKQKKRLDGMQDMLQQQEAILLRIASKLDIAPPEMTHSSSQLSHGPPSTRSSNETISLSNLHLQSSSPRSSRSNSKV